MADPVVTITNGVPTSGTGTITTLGAVVTALGTPMQATGGSVAITGTAAVSAVSLPLPTGAATAAKQPALGTAGTPSTDVISVQGVASGTAMPVSAASLPLPTGAATAALQPTAAAIGSTTSGQTGHVVMGAVTTGAPTYTTGQTDPLSLDTAGNLRVNVVTGSTSGAVAQGSTTSGQTGSLTQGAVTTAAPTYTAAQTSPLSLDTAGNLRTVITNANANVGNNSDAVAAASTTAAPVVNYGYGFNGTTWDRLQVDGSKNLKVLSAVTATANGATASRVNAAASTNATSIKASAGQVYTIDVFNAAAYNVFLKLYNKAIAPTVGTDTPIMTIPVQAGGGFSKTWPMGLTFSTGIAYAITKLQADTDTTVLVAGDLTGNTTWI